MNQTFILRFEISKNWSLEKQLIFIWIYKFQPFHRRIADILDPSHFEISIKISLASNMAAYSIIPLLRPSFHSIPCVRINYHHFSKPTEKSHFIIHAIRQTKVGHNVNWIINLYQKQTSFYVLTEYSSLDFFLLYCMSIYSPNNLSIILKELYTAM